MKPMSRMTERCAIVFDASDTGGQGTLTAACRLHEQEPAFAVRHPSRASPAAPVTRAE